MPRLTWTVVPSPVVVTAARRGFETAVHLRGRPRSLVVEALDRSGAVLGTSAAVTVRRAPG